MARADKWGTKGYSKGKNGDSYGGLSRAAHEEVSRILVRILRYESSKYGLEGPEGWVSLEELLQKCKSQIKNSPAEVLQVALDSEGSQGKRFEVDHTQRWLRARYKHGGKSGKGKGRGGAYGANDGSFRGGWESYTASNGSNGASAPRQSWQNPGGKDPWADGDDPWQKGTSQRPEAWRGEASSSSASGANWRGSPSDPPEINWNEQSANETKHEAQTELQQDQQAQKPTAHSSAPSAPSAPSANSHPEAEMKSTDVPTESTTPGVESYDISTPRQKQKGEVWEKFLDPNSGKPWLSHTETGEFFFVHMAGTYGWSQYSSDLGAWWHHDKTGRWFFDPKVAE